MLWRGRDQSAMQSRSHETGFTELNHSLPTGGWPAGAITEIIVDHWGSGELQLLIPLLVRQSQQYRPITFIAPPHVPYAPALANAGIELAQITILDDTLSTDDVWWSAEKILGHPDCGATLIWPHHHHHNQLRRLQLAISRTTNPGFVFYSRLPGQSPLPLRLKVNRYEDQITVHILKSRFGWTTNQTITIPTLSP